MSYHILMSQETKHQIHHWPTKLIIIMINIYQGILGLFSLFHVRTTLFSSINIGNELMLISHY